MKEKVFAIISNITEAPKHKIENEPLGFIPEDHLQEILNEIEETFEVVFDEDDLDKAEEMTLDQLVARVSELGGKIPE